MKSRIIAILIILTLIMGMTACSHKNNHQGSSSDELSGSAGQETVETGSSDAETESADSPDSLQASHLSISYFDWDVKEKIIEKALSYTLTLRNRSPYPILSTEITYKTRDNVSDRSLRLFDKFKENHKKYINPDEDNRNIVLIGKSDAYVKSGQYLYDVPVTIGIHSMTWYDAPNYDQFILMQPDTLSLGLVKNNLLYHCHYDFINKTWSIDESPEKLNNWPDSSLTKLIPEPSCDYFRVSTDKDSDYLIFTVYGYSEEAYKAYVESVREAGFTKKQDKGKRYYSAEDKKGNSIDVMYDQSNWNMNVTVNL